MLSERESNTGACRSRQQEDRRRARSLSAVVTVLSAWVSGSDARKHGPDRSLILR